MPLTVPQGNTTLFIRREAFERTALTRQAIDERLNLTADEFRVEGALIAIGPLAAETGISELIEELEGAGLAYYDDFFELSGNWPDWLRLVAMS
jgi:hypothetical protein